MEEKLDKELVAINQIIKALQDLDPAARKRVLDYTLERLGVSSRVLTENLEVRSIKEPRPSADSESSPRATLGKEISDIRALRAEKNPKSAIQMAVVVAYYLQELAPEKEKKDFVTAADISKYFKQANFPLPGGKSGGTFTLSNAKNSGYLDPGSETGTYKLNPVGFNLVAHNLPLQKSTQKSKKRNAKKRK